MTPAPEVAGALAAFSAFSALRCRALIFLLGMLATLGRAVLQ